MVARLSGTNLVRVADHNQRVTLHAIRVKGSLTRVDLATITGLTQPAIANITKRLLADGLIQEAGQLRGGRGQPATKYTISPDSAFSFGINIDRDHVTFVLVNFNGEILARRSHEIAFALPLEVVRLWNEALDELLQESGIDPARLVGIGIAIPDDLGVIDLPGRPAEYAQWDDADLEQLFTEPLRLPVFVENDAAAAAMGEMQLGLGQQESSFFYLLISLALGGGVVVDGHYYRGAQGRSGEIGFLKSQLPGGQPHEIQKVVSLSGLKEHFRARNLDTALVVQPDLVGEEAEALTSWLEASAELLRGPLLAVNCLLNPHSILIGGRLPSGCVERLAALINDKLATDREQAPEIAPVERAALSEDAPAVGGAILPFSHFLLPKTTSLWKTDHADRAA